jgi:hypothetical protein
VAAYTDSAGPQLSDRRSEDLDTVATVVFAGVLVALAILSLYLPIAF